MSQTFLISTDLTTINCGECGGVYAINERYRKQKEDKGGWWNCPYCKTSWGYGESTVQKLRKQLDAQCRDLVAERSRHDQTRAKLRETEQTVIAQKAATTRAKKRSAAGVCPCCHRTVKQMARHMATKHPDFVKESMAAK